MRVKNQPQDVLGFVLRLIRKARRELQYFILMLMVCSPPRTSNLQASNFGILIPMFGLLDMP